MMSDRIRVLGLSATALLFSAIGFLNPGAAFAHDRDDYRDGYERGYWVGYREAENGANTQIIFPTGMTPTVLAFTTGSMPDTTEVTGKDGTGGTIIRGGEGYSRPSRFGNSPRRRIEARQDLFTVFDITEERSDLVSKHCIQRPESIVHAGVDSLLMSLGCRVSSFQYWNR
jgi:hypothetical protein